MIILISNVSCDQISKNIIRQKFGENERISLMNNHLIIIKTENTGAFLSLGHSLPSPINILLLTILPLIVLGFASVYLLTKRDLTNLKISGICFIIGGGFGNIYDRAIYGSVIDFLHIDFGLFHTGIFNMADVSIMTGIFILFVDIYINKTKLREGI